MNTDKVAEQIYALRKAKGLTQNELGERVGVSFQAVGKQMGAWRNLTRYFSFARSGKGA